MASKIKRLYRQLAALAAVFSGSNLNSPEFRRKRSFCHKSRARTHSERLARLAGNADCMPPSYESGGQEFESLRARHKFNNSQTKSWRP